MPEKTYIEAIRDGIREEMQRDERVMILGEDVGAKGGVFGVTEGLQKEFGEWRVLDSPLAESLIVGVAIGAAMNGLRPIAEIQFQDFIMPAVDQIISEAAKIRYRSNGDWNVPMVLRSPFGGGVHGALYHSQSIEAIFAHIPGLRVVVPSNPYDAKGMIVAALRDPDPVLYFEHKRAYRAIKGEVPDGEYTVPLDQARVVREGEDIALFSYGMMVHASLEAAERLAADGFSCEVVDLRSLRPFDRAAIVDERKQVRQGIDRAGGEPRGQRCVRGRRDHRGGLLRQSRCPGDASWRTGDSGDAILATAGTVLPGHTKQGRGEAPRARRVLKDKHKEAREMALTVTMPQLGESVTEGTIARWLKHPGDAIAKYESIAEVITDKVNAEIPAPADGVMSELIAPEGAVVPVGQPICSIDTGGGAPDATAEPLAEEVAAVATHGGAERGDRARRASCAGGESRARGASGGRRDRRRPNSGCVQRVPCRDRRRRARLPAATGRRVGTM